MRGEGKSKDRHTHIYRDRDAVAEYLKDCWPKHRFRVKKRREGNEARESGSNVATNRWNWSKCKDSDMYFS